MARQYCLPEFGWQLPAWLPSARPVLSANADPSAPCPLADMQRPAELISYPQQIAITATGIIWSRFSTQITPVSGRV